MALFESTISSNVCNVAFTGMEMLNVARVRDLPSSGHPLVPCPWQDRAKTCRFLYHNVTSITKPCGGLCSDGVKIMMAARTYCVRSIMPIRLQSIWAIVGTLSLKTASGMSVGALDAATTAASSSGVGTSDLCVVIVCHPAL